MWASPHRTLSSVTPEFCPRATCQPLAGCWAVPRPLPRCRGGDFRAGETQGFHMEGELGTSLKAASICIAKAHFLLRLFQIHKVGRICIRCFTCLGNVKYCMKGY